MIIVRLKAKNQLTLPAAILKRVGIEENELFSVEFENNYIKLTPVDIEPRYTAEELAGLDRMADAQKGQGTVCRTKAEVVAHLKKIIAK